jgi:hypothetical protein
MSFRASQVEHTILWDELKSPFDTFDKIRNSIIDFVTIMTKFNGTELIVIQSAPLAKDS